MGQEGEATAGRRCQLPLGWVCRQMDKEEQHPVPLLSWLSQYGPAQAPGEAGWKSNLERPLPSPRMTFFLEGVSNQRMLPKMYIAFDSIFKLGSPAAAAACTHSTDVGIRGCGKQGQEEGAALTGRSLPGDRAHGYPNPPAPPPCGSHKVLL